MTLIEIIGDPQVVLGLAPEELGKSLLRCAQANLHNNIFHPDTAMAQQHGQPVYPAQFQNDIERAVSEAWQWLTLNMLIVPVPGINGTNGFKTFSRRGQQLVADEQSFDAYRMAAAFPKAMLHESIADRVWIELARGSFDIAVFIAFREVEIAVRRAGVFAATDLGVDMMRRAFHPENGPLTRRTDPPGEREGLMHLFAGAVGSYKNSHSHRSVQLTDAREAQEMVMLASHLLRIVDGREQMRQAAPVPAAAAARSSGGLLR